MLDDAGYEDCSICASNSLDEFTIRDILMEGACVDSFGVGERMITSSSEPVFGGVYKLAGIEDEHGNIIPKIKIYQLEDMGMNIDSLGMFPIPETNTIKIYGDYMTEPAAKQLQTL